VWLCLWLPLQLDGDSGLDVLMVGRTGTMTVSWKSTAVFTRFVSATGSDAACVASATTHCASVGGAIAAWLPSEARSFPKASYAKLTVVGDVAFDGVVLGGMRMRRRVVIVGGDSTATLTCLGSRQEAVAVEVCGPQPLVIRSVRVRSCSAGFLRALAASVILVDVTFVDVSSSASGAVATLADVSTLTALRCSFTNVTTRGAFGGAVFAQDSRVSLSQCAFRNASAPVGAGGAVAVASAVTCQSALCSDLVASATASATSFSGCGATLGGALYVQGGTLTVAGGAVTGNSASGRGGGVAVDGVSASLSLSGVTFTANSGGSGGSVSVFDAASVSISSCSVSQSTATVGGGALELAGVGVVTVVNTSTTSAVAQGGSGGAVLWTPRAASTFTVNASTLRGTAANGCGGGIAVVAAPALQHTLNVSASFPANSAAFGTCIAIAVVFIVGSSCVTMVRLSSVLQARHSARAPGHCCPTAHASPTPRRATVRRRACRRRTCVS
jgi:hypothetical protein